MCISRLDFRSGRELRIYLFIGGSGALPELLSALVVPFFDLFVGLDGESFCREIDGEGFAVIWVLDSEDADGVLDEGDVFFGAEEDLYGLPSDEAFLCEGGDGWRCEVVGCRLQRMLAAYRCIDP